MSKDAKKERAWPQFETAEAEQIRAWATANGYGSRSFNEQVRLAALYASRDFIVAAETANAR